MGLNFKAIIVGGSVGGLTMAHAFESAGVDYVLLEGADEIAPFAGVAIGIMPNGARILDQLGVYDSMSAISQPLNSVTTRKSNGTLVTENRWPEAIRERLGYPVSIFKRQEFLQSLYNQLKDKSRLLVNKRVSEIKHFAESVSVICTDGTNYSGNIVIGADGIHSKVRQEMQRIAQCESPGLMEDDQKKIISEYSAFYGISTPPTCHEPGTIHLSSAVDHSSVMVIGQDSICQWFFVTKSPSLQVWPNISRLGERELVLEADQHKDFKVTDRLEFRDLLANCKKIGHTPLEEANHEHWTWGRIVCIGDSVHKMTPSLAQGGNQAIESAAVLTNVLLPLLSTSLSSCPSTDLLTTALNSYQDQRRSRAGLFVQTSGQATRVEALATFEHTLRFLYMTPWTTKQWADLQTELLTSAPALEHRPLPERTRGNPYWDSNPKEEPLEVRVAKLLARFSQAV